MISLGSMAATEALRNFFHIYDVQNSGQLTLEQLSHMYENIRVGGISFAQVAASMENVCGASDYILLEELKDVLEEIDRRYYLIQDLQWEFALLDNQHSGKISVEKARFLVEAVHGKLFSISRWNSFLRRRVVPDATLSFADIEVELCNLPTPDRLDINIFGSDQRKLEKLVKEQEKRRKEEKQERERFQAEQARKEMYSPALSTTNDTQDVDAKPTTTAEKNHNDSITKETAAQNKEQEEERLRKEEKKREKEERKREKSARKEKRAADQQRLVDQLETAMESKKIEILDPAVKEYKRGITRKSEQDELLAQAERLLQMLKCSSALKDAMVKRVIADLETAINKAKKSGFDRSEEELANEVAAADDLLLRIKRLEKLRSEVLELKQSTIAELRSYQKPMPVIHNVMIATYLLLGTTEKDTKDWQNIQALLGRTGREGLKRRIGQCNVLSIPLSTARRAKDVMGVVDLEAIRDVSAGAATFFVWAEGMIEEVESNGSKKERI